MRRVLGLTLFYLRLFLFSFGLGCLGFGFGFRFRLGLGFLLGFLHLDGALGALHVAVLTLGCLDTLGIFLGFLECGLGLGTGLGTSNLFSNQLVQQKYFVF